MTTKMRKSLFWVLVFTLIAGLAIAALELGGQANKSAARAGSDSADFEMASLDSIKKPEKSTIDWKQERALYKKIEDVDKNYRAQLTQAERDIDSSGEVSKATRKAGLDLAKDFKKASEEYAKFWDKNNGPTRAKLAREAGESRIKSAEVAFNDVDSKKVAENNKQQEELRNAQKAYFADAKNDLSKEDRASLKSELLPRLKNMASRVTQLIGDITALISQIQSQVSSATSSPVGFAKNLMKGKGSNPATLLNDAKNLLSMVKNLGTNVNSMMSDINAL